MCRYAVGPEMSRNDAGLLAAAGGLLRWQRNTKFCQKCGSPVRLVKAGHKVGGVWRSKLELRDNSVEAP